MTRLDTVLSRGNTSDVYALGVDAVVKVPRPEVSDHWIEIEARHATAAYEAGLPTPKVLDVSEINGRPSIVFERIFGPSMLDRIISTPEKVDALARDMAAIQRELHSHSAPAALPGLHGRLSRKIQEAADVTAADRAAAEAVLQTLPEGSAVCHGDLHPGNILLGGGGPVVIDWFDATAATPAADVVRSSLLIRPLRSASPPPHLSGADAGVLDRFHRVYVTSMVGSVDVDVRSLLSWEAVRAVGRLAEPLAEEIDDLVAVWQSRADLSLAPSTPLGRVLRAATPSEE